MKYASLFVLVLIATGCGDSSSSPPTTTGPDDSDTTTGSNSSHSTGSNGSASRTTSSSSTSTVGHSNVSSQPSGTATSSGTAPTSGGTSGTTVATSDATTSDVSEIPDCETVVNFDSEWGVVATGGGTNPETWETSVTPSFANGVFSAEIPFTSSAQQFGWNGDYPDGPVDCAGRELVARLRLRSGFVDDPETAPGGVLMYLFSNDWANSKSTWNNIPAPSDDWFEATVGCEASEESAFDPALVNGVGFTFNSGGADAEAYVATTATFEVDQLCWRGTGETSDAGSGGEPDGGSEVTDPSGDAGTSFEEPDASVVPTDAGDESSTTSSVSSTSTSTTSTGGSSTSSTSGSSTSGSSNSQSSTSGSSTSNSSSSSDECEIFVDFDDPWGFVATGGGTSPEAWEEDVEPLIADGLFNVTVPFSSAAQQYGWVGDYPGSSTVDCTGWELVARVRLNTDFVENPETQAGGVQVYLFSNSWAAGINEWNVVDEESDEWFEASVSCETVGGSDFNPAMVNAVGFTFNTGGDLASDYDAYAAEFDVDYLCWRKQ